ncbi:MULTISPECIES: DUF4347 domain-containing protein [unclassified Nodularia (in: cyanobacteria)]|uniref:DUF4347 domain-containing protein n=1 Tax=unclassified Nodularia (in: cyanobacteria) TaxID=2656917 RepID=UPI00187F0AB0|nr:MULTISPECIES: DUF4347 domain-containing protein [unclassified Nodularia (in: cyanobacteria)]MBE9200432.1 DUF4347 domain-containing protein [Nodularia sp. LEGE 06071]MCC2694757.1 DUF4347 domain-containing protein [Nodularia sp. LEGE 04288]
MLNKSLFSQTNTVVFIDSSVPDYKTLQNGILEGAKTFILSRERDGIAEITELLQQNSQITTLHIISHGSPKSLYLGNTQLSLDNLQNYQSLTTTWNVESILLHNSNSSINTRYSTGDRIAYVGLIGKPTSTNKINLSDTLITTSTPEAGSAVLPEINQTDIRRDEKAIFARFSLANNVTEREITSVQPNINQAVDPVIPTTHPRILGCSCSSCARPLVDLNRINNEPQQLTAPVSAALDLSQTFFLNSLAGANQTIYLDFNGHTTSGTAWNQNFTNGANIVTPAFDLDGNPASFSSTELERIQYIWQRVAEDFIPFNVNVTTQAPTDINDLIKSGANDTRWGVRAVIGGSGLDWIGQRLSGIAYFGSFNWNTDTPTFMFSEDMSEQEKPTAETISHEVGHTLGLSHDGRISPSEEYYYGHGSGDTGWAPIMGFSDFQNVTQWSKGQYASAKNTEDDLQIITTQNGFGYRTDDTGNTIATAKALTVSGTTFSGSGIIERNTDIDFYSFYTGAGAISLTVNPFTRGPNLDILAELYNSVGTLLVSSNPTESLFAIIDTSVDAGTYYLKIDGVGKGNPLGTGYTDYGSLGQYFISGNIAASITEPPVVTPTSTALSYIENATTIIDPAITVSDVDSPNLASATVRITSGFVSSQDILSFTNQNGITGNYNNSIGVLTLTGAATVANYQTALRSITYTNSSDSPNTTPRTISFQVNDGGLNSTTVNRNINVTAVNDAPTNLNLSNNAVADNQAVGTIIGNLSTTDPDIGDSFTYSLVTGTGATDNASFTISGNQLQTNAIFNYATKNIYSVLVRTTDQGGLSYDRQFTININPNNQDNVVTGTANNENFTTTAQKDIINAQGGNDTITSTFDNLQQNDTLNGGTEIDTLIITGGTSANAITINSNNANQFNIPGTTIIGFERFDLSGFTGKISFVGNSGDDWIQAGAGNDNLTGGNGNDYLNGGTGADTMIGGAGNDFYYVDNVGDKITENFGQGTDTAFSTISYTLGNNLENLTLEGTSAINGTGNSLNNILIGNSGNNVLNGQAGADTMIGGEGNDSYYVNNAGDTITEIADQGTDTVFSTISYTLENHVENLTLEGTSAINGTGNDLNNILTGNSRNNVLNGQAGADTMIGGAGNDSYYVDYVGDTIIELAGQGTDNVFSTISYTLENNLENLTLEGTSAINGTGNDLINILTGNAAANTLTGDAGADTLIGNAGADTLIGGTGNDKLYLGLNDGAVDIVNYALNDGADTVYQFVRGAGGDQIQFTGIPNIDVVRSFSNTLLRLGDGIAGNSGFGSGQLLVTLSATTGFIGADVNVNLFGANFLFT